MRVISFNANGIRSADSKGYFQWQRRQDADVICLQEVRALPEQMSAQAKSPRRYFAYFHPAERKGYSGVGLYSKVPADKVWTELGWPEFDNQGRYLQADFGSVSVISLYLPSGSSGPERLAAKFRFLELLYAHMQRLRADGRSYILCADWNIAHRNIDLENWRSNRKNSGFLPEERAWLDRVLGEQGWVDAFRVVNQEAKQYTWWSNRGQAYAKNVGWRLDYQLVTPDLADRVMSTSIYRTKRFSDHAPVTIDYRAT